MLRAGICDLGTCDLEMGWPVSLAGPASCRCAAHPPRPLTASSAWKGGQLGTRSPGPPPGMRSAAGWPASGAFRRSTADLRRYLQADDDLPHLRPGTLRRFPPGCRPFPAGPCVSALGRGVSARRVPRVSPRVPWRYRRSMVAFPPGVPRCFRRTAVRAAGRSRRGRPYGPGAGVRRRPVPRRAIHSRAAVRDGRIPAGTPAGGQPLTSGPARVRLTRRMTRRSRSIAVR